ncbi:MAG: VTT domain-containing protein [Candidatus Ratteibacteria bacterium]|nr:VTT domain-containing protein [Candidatus Ratteibacteria bacterium]
MMLTEIEQYELIGLFITSVFGSTIFIPFSVEVSLAVLSITNIPPISLIAVATIGSVIGSLMNYGIGIIGFKWFESKFPRYEHELKKAELFSKKHGDVGLFFALLIPIYLPVDFLTILAGACKMQAKKFIMIVFFGKLIKYSIVIILLFYFKTSLNLF